MTIRRRVSSAVLIVALATAFFASGPRLALGASPEPSGPAAGGDPRSSGEGPGFVGEPLLAIGGVLGIGLLSAAATLAYVRLTRRP